MAPISNSNESYCTFTLASDVTAGGLPSEAEIAKDLESNDDNVRPCLSCTVRSVGAWASRWIIGFGFFSTYCSAVESYAIERTDLLGTVADTMPETMPSS
jgi:hypothetical protein